MALNVGKVVGLKDKFTGQTFFGQQITRTPEKNPLCKKQWVRVTITLEPPTFTKKAVMKVEMHYDDFLAVVAKIQQKYPGKVPYYKTLDFCPDWVRQEQEAKKA